MPETVECERHVRSRSPSDELSLSPPQAKRQKVDEDAESATSATSDDVKSLDDLPDDVLIQLFSFLNPIDLVHLSLSCLRFADICQYRTLWEQIDSTSLPLSAQSNYQIIRHVKTNTKTIKLRGNKSDPSDVTFSKKMMNLVTSRAPYLKTLVLENHVLDAFEMVLEDFPETLEHLAVRDSLINNLPGGASFVYRINIHLSRLKVLDLTNSPWFSSHGLLAISKIPTLEELVLNGCDLTDFMPYASLASKFGFKKLQSLDLRNTEVGDSDVTCFSEKESLRRLYLSAPPLSHLREINLVSDHGITAFGARRLTLIIPNGVQYVLRNAELRHEAVQSPCQLETLVLRDYPEVTNRTLRHTGNQFKTLKFLDVTGCGVTKEGLDLFRSSRPDVTLLPLDV